MNWKTEQKKLPQSEEGEMEEKNKQSLRGHETIKKYLVFVSLESKRE